MKRRLFGILRRVGRDYGRDLLARGFLAVAADMGFETKLVEWVDQHDGTVIYKGGPDEQRDDDIWISFDLITSPRTKMKGTVIYYNLEPLPLPHWVGGWPEGLVMGFYTQKLRPFLKECGGAVDMIIDYNEWTSRFLLEHGHKVAFCPPGYHESMELPPDTKPFEKGIYNLGRPGNNRRAKIAQDCGGTTMFCRGRPDLRDRLHVTPGVHLNLHRLTALFTFGAIRVLQLALPNRRFVLSEPCYWSPLISGEHWVEAPTRKLPEIAQHYLRHDKERDEIAESGYQWVKKSLHLKNWIPRAFNVLGII